MILVKVLVFDFFEDDAVFLLILKMMQAVKALIAQLSQARKSEQENFPAFQKFPFNSLLLEKIDRRILPQPFRNLCVAFILAVVMTSHLFRNLIPKSCP